MDTVTSTGIWQTTLDSKSGDDSYTLAREKFRTSFVSFRERAAHLAAEIHRDLPDFTVHDITHLDSLWEIADIIGGPELLLTPPEAFVLGGAFLLHDLGMSLASYPQGIEELKKRQTWKDTIAFQFKEKYNRQPTTEELTNPPNEITKASIAHLLRVLHAEQAERLGMATWTTPDSKSTEYLIQDADIRQSYGRIVGLIAHSHWWSVEELEGKFPRTLGAPHWCPKEWTVDPLKLSCLLRLADAGHIDARRAPYFLRAIRRISQPSSEHWAFQQRLGKPHLTDDALAYTTGYAFPFNESASWWLCFDTLRMIDKELRTVDALLSDKGMHRFAARRIAGIESPERLTTYIPTACWSPVDASIQVSDVPRLLISLGGKELYGKNPRIALRELIQNASDAVRARCAIEQRSADWGQITVRLGKDGEKYWLEVEDNGIGMSQSVLTKYLLDFSTSFWGSGSMIDELPGLLGSGFLPTGRYGIGFFSVFMLGNSVRVRTRRSDAAQKDTLVLEFNMGLNSRPILREAKSEELLRDGGTAIKVWFSNPPTDSGGLLWRHSNTPPASLEETCSEVCPSLPVSLYCEQNGTTTRVLKGDDWMSCPGRELFSRTCRWWLYNDDSNSSDHTEFLDKAAENLRLISDSEGIPIGRICIGIPDNHRQDREQTKELRGAVTVGGLYACHIRGIAGVLSGTPDRAARDHATPIISAEALAKWASEQALLIPNLYNSPVCQMECATIIRRCGGHTAGLPIAKYEDTYVSIDDITAMTLPDQVFIISPYRVDELEKLSGFKFVPGVFITQTGSWMSILSVREYSNWPDRLFSNWGSIMSVSTTLGGSVVEAVAKAWDCPLDILAYQVKNQERHENEHIIGYLGEQEIKRDLLVLSKPEGNTRTNTP